MTRTRMRDFGGPVLLVAGLFLCLGTGGRAAPGDHFMLSPADVPKISVEAGATFGWSRWVDASIGIDSFGASGKGDKVLAHLGISPEAVAERVAEIL